MSDHAHPCNFRLSRWIDRGWGELACEYRWNSTRNPQACDSYPELERCFLFEVTTYHSEEGTQEGEWLTFDAPPFAGWAFRNPTDGRRCIAGQERFSASAGSAWDRHKLAGRLRLPEREARYCIRARQRYAFHCELCGAIETLLEAPPILRTFERREGGIWRYRLEKGEARVWMDVSAEGYANDSAGIGISPWFE